MAGQPTLQELATRDPLSDDANSREDATLIGKPLISKVNSSDVQHSVMSKTVSEASMALAVTGAGPAPWRLWLSFQASLKVFVKTQFFNISCLMVLLLSCMLLSFEANVSAGASETWYIEVAGHTMAILFIVEWTLRSLASGLAFFKDLQNIMFTVVVWLPLFLSADPRYNSVRVLVRCLRLGRVVDTVKHVESLRTVWMLIAGLFGSAMTLMWSCILIFLTVFFFSVMAVEMVGRSSVWENAETEPNCPECYWAVQFKTVGSAMFVMSRFMNHDGAMDVLESILTRQKYIWMFFYAFMALSVYVLLNLVTAIIVDRALQLAGQDEEHQVLQAMEARRNLMKELSQLFSELDVDKSGFLTKEEFMQAFKVDALSVKLQLMGIHQNDLKDIFDVLNVDGDSHLEMREFCKGLPKMFGDCKSYDMLIAQKKLERCEKHFDDILTSQGMQTVQKHRHGTTDDITTLADMMDFLDDMTKGRLAKLEQGIKKARELTEEAASALAC